jgi:hypothetical protein
VLHRRQDRVEALTPTCMLALRHRHIVEAAPLPARSLRATAPLPHPTLVVLHYRQVEIHPFELVLDIGSNPALRLRS